MFQHNQSVSSRWVLVPRRSLGRLLGAMVVLAVCSLGIGCSRKSPDFIPSSDTSRQALETALNAWVSGQRAGPIENASPPIQVVDSAWWKGQRLTSYEILDQETGQDGSPCFSVRLHKSKPRGDETVRYVVTGRSPVWVYREEDYKRSQSWEGLR